MVQHRLTVNLILPEGFCGCRQVSEEFAEGWLAVIDTMTNLLQAGYAPTASAVTAITRKKPGDYCLNPKAARYFLKNGGRQVTHNLVLSSTSCACQSLS